jgi:hypothetical protein
MDLGGVAFEMYHRGRLACSASSDEEVFLALWIGCGSGSGSLHEGIGLDKDCIVFRK